MPDSTWQMQLMARYPQLFRQPVHGRRLGSGYPAVGDGWRTLVETAVARIDTALTPSFTGAVTITDIKEKLGTLRIYMQIAWLPPTTKVKVEEAIDLAEARSATTCETCGALGRLYDDNGGYATCCDTHWRGTPLPVRAGQENLLIRYAFVDGRLRVESCHRYHRDRDIFVHAPLPRERGGGGG